MEASRENRADRIKALEARADQLRARARQLALADAKKNRALETRRKILLGSCLASRVAELAGKSDVLSEAAVLSWLSAYLTRPGDRAAFGLPPLPERTD